MSARASKGGLSGFLSAYRWPLFLGGLLVMSVTAQGVLVWVATRPDNPLPIADYYQKSLEWDADTALIEASRQLGWRVTVDIPAGREYAVGARRPVDISVFDRDGEPVTELVGRLIAERPSNLRLNGESELVEMPDQAGNYRTLAALSAPGLWEFHLDTHRGETRFVYSERVVIPEEAVP